MKKTILLTLTVIISYASIGQKMTTQDTIDIIDKHGWQNAFKRATNPINLPISSKWISGHIDNGDKLQFIEQKERGEVLRLNAKGDTLEIKSQSIKYIKIDGKVYEIKRYTELKEVSDNYGIFISPKTWENFMPTINVDTSYYKPIKIQK